jgi:hypothetical protein
MERINWLDVMIAEHKLRTERVNRLGWMVDEDIRSGTGAARTPARGRATVWLRARLVAAVKAVGLAPPEGTERVGTAASS